MSPSPRLLLLEDELPLARIVRESLERQGYQVHHAANGVLGLAAFQRDTFDLCIVDVMLPQLDGFAFVAEVRRTNQQVPILFLTAKSQPADVVQGFGVGGNDYLRKHLRHDPSLAILNIRGVGYRLVS